MKFCFIGFNNILQQDQISTAPQCRRKPVNLDFQWPSQIVFFPGHCGLYTDSFCLSYYSPILKQHLGNGHNQLSNLSVVTVISRGTDV